MLVISAAPPKTFNGSAKSRYTAKDYADINLAQRALEPQLVGKSAAQMAKMVKEWLRMNVQTFSRSWTSIMSHMGPPCVDISVNLSGAITRAQAARTAAEALANLNAQKARDALADADEELAAKDEAIREMQERLARMVDERGGLADQRQAKAEEADAKAKEAQALSAQLDAANDAVQEAQARQALAELRAEEAEEARRQEQEARRQEQEARLEAEARMRLAEAERTHHEQEAAKATAMKRKLAQALAESVEHDAKQRLDFGLSSSAIKAHIANGNLEAANRLTEDLNRAIIVHNTS